MEPLITGAVILFGLLALGQLFNPAREQQVVIIREPTPDAVGGTGCGTLLLIGFLALLLFVLLASGG